MTSTVERARDWIGTPYVHQARRRGAGCDCLGLILGLWAEQGGALPDLPPYSRDWSEPQGEERLWNAARRLLVSRDDAPCQEGQILLFRMRRDAVAKHLGIVSAAGAAPRFIHAMTGRGVIESALTPPWARRVVARFEFPPIGG